MIHFYYGLDEWAIEQAVTQRRRQLEELSYTHIKQEAKRDLDQALEVAATSSFTGGRRLVWLEGATLTNEALGVLQHLPETTDFIFSAPALPDARLKVTKWLKQVAEIQAFELVPAWREDLLRQWVRTRAVEFELDLDESAVQALVEIVGNQSRLLHHELEKLSLLGEPIGEKQVRLLCQDVNQSSLAIATALLNRKGKVAIAQIQGLIQNREPGLKIIATISSQFRTWLTVKVLIDQSKDDLTIAQTAGIGNPNRLYYLRKELSRAKSQWLQNALQWLLEAEYRIKSGVNEAEVLIEMAMKFT